MALNTKATVFGLNLDGSVDTQDNGKGWLGANTRDPSLVGVSLPIPAIEKMYGSLPAARKAIAANGAPTFDVTNPATGQTVTAPLVDVGPSAGQQAKGIGLDLTLGASRALGGTGLNPMNYVINSAPGSVSGINPGEFGTNAVEGLVNPLVATSDSSPTLISPFTPSVPSAPSVQTGGVNPATGQLVPGATAGPESAKTSKPFNPIEAASALFTNMSAAKGGSPVGNTIAAAIPSLLGPLTNGIAGRDTTSNMGKVGGSIRNFFEGDIGSGNVNDPWPSITESIKNVFSSFGGNNNAGGLSVAARDAVGADGSTTGSSSANGIFQGGMASIRNFFGNNGSSNSTGPVGLSNVDTSRKG